MTQQHSLETQHKPSPFSVKAYFILPYSGQSTPTTKVNWAHLSHIIQLGAWLSSAQEQMIFSTSFFFG